MHLPSTLLDVVEHIRIFHGNPACDMASLTIADSTLRKHCHDLDDSLDLCTSQTIAKAPLMLLLVATAIIATTSTTGILSNCLRLSEREGYERL